MDDSREVFAGQALQQPTAGARAMRPEYRRLTKVEQLKLDTIKNLGAALFDVIDALGESREISLAKTNLEQAVMWAVKHITR